MSEAALNNQTYTLYTGKQVLPACSFTPLLMHLCLCLSVIVFSYLLLVEGTVSDLRIVCSAFFFFAFLVIRISNFCLGWKTGWLRSSALL